MRTHLLATTGVAALLAAMPAYAPTMTGWLFRRSIGLAGATECWPQRRRPLRKILLTTIAATTLVLSLALHSAPTMAQNNGGAGGVAGVPGSNGVTTGGSSVAGTGGAAGILGTNNGNGGAGTAGVNGGSGGGGGGGANGNGMSGTASIMNTGTLTGGNGGAGPRHRSDACL